MMDNKQCQHDRLNEDGICRQCGSDKRGIGEPVAVCDTTMTPRVAPHWCMCLKRTDQMGPCRTWEEGANGRCVYCDHEHYCHQMLEAAVAKEKP